MKSSSLFSVSTDDGLSSRRLAASQYLFSFLSVFKALLLIRFQLLSDDGGGSGGGGGDGDGGSSGGGDGGDGGAGAGGVGDDDCELL